MRVTRFSERGGIEPVQMILTSLDPGWLVPLMSSISIIVSTGGSQIENEKNLGAIALSIN